MRFWDSSALVPLILEEQRSAEMRRLLQADPVLLVWLLTPLEVWTALCRRRTLGELADPDLEQASAGLQELEKAWSPITDVAQVLARARRLVATHPLRSADSLQLAAALVVSGERPERLPFVCLDERLAQCAMREGFPLLP